MSAVTRTIQRLVDVREGEMQALLLSAAYFFFVLSAWYVLRPIRDEMAVAGGVDNLPWMFLGTLVLMVIVNPPFAAIVVRFSRNRFVALSYRFFMLNLLVFFALWHLMSTEQQIWLGRAFYWWGSVFNLFVVSIFWAFMSDVWKMPQSKRLYGFIGVGGTLGAITGSTITAWFAQLVSAPINLVFVSIVFLEIAVWIVRRLSALFSALREQRGEQDTTSERIGGSTWAGISHVAKSPYLMGICLYVLMYTIVGTVLYFAQAEIASQISDRGARTSFFGWIDSATNAITVVTQVFLTGRFIRWMGVGVTLAVLPTFVLLGFTALGFWPTTAVIVIVQALRRASNFSLARPARETLFTVVSREDRFKAKALIDTFVYRAGDQLGAWGYAGLGAVGLTLSGIAFVSVPIVGVWLMVSLWLGAKQTAMHREQADAESGAPTVATA
ncbi:MAG: MFS transporter [Gemmatimonadetes bacterium]|nr:MFS transporter [Gemmatimonadota bacterium]